MMIGSLLLLQWKALGDKNTQNSSFGFICTTAQ